MTFKDDIEDADLDVMINTDEFAVDVIWNTVPYKGIFDDAFSGVNLDSNVIDTTSPQVIVKNLDFSAVVHNDVLIINSISYKVIKAEPDGTGLITIFLSQD